MEIRVIIKEKSEKLYTCKDYSYGVKLGTNDHFAQYKAEGKLLESVKYKKVGECCIVVSKGVGIEGHVILDTIVQSLKTGNNYCVVGRYYTEIEDCAKKEKIRSLKSGIKELIKNKENIEKKILIKKIELMECK